MVECATWGGFAEHRDATARQGRKPSIEKGDIEVVGRAVVANRGQPPAKIFQGHLSYIIDPELRRVVGELIVGKPVTNDDDAVTVVYVSGGDGSPIELVARHSPTGERTVIRVRPIRTDSAADMRALDLKAGDLDGRGPATHAPTEWCTTYEPDTAQESTKWELYNAVIIDVDFAT